MICKGIKEFMILTLISLELCYILKLIFPKWMMWKYLIRLSFRCFN